MNHSRILAVCAALAAAFAADAGDPEAGQAKAATCAACHGGDGRSANPIWPSLAGQHESYIVAQLQAYQNGSRADPMMTGMAMGLDEQDMLDLGAFYAAQEPPALTAEPALVDVGAALYRGGNADKGIPACLACHGPRGAGNPAAGWPRVAGQHAEYAAHELREFRSGERATDMQSMMRDVARNMSDEEIEAVANYMQGLR